MVDRFRGSKLGRGAEEPPMSSRVRASCVLTGCVLVRDTAC
jgi:hypothetical protein